jgi:hypothetical protein
VINDNVMLYVTNVCFAETNGKLGRITGISTTTVKTIPEIRTHSQVTTESECQGDVDTRNLVRSFILF